MGILNIALPMAADQPSARAVDQSAFSVYILVVLRFTWQLTSPDQHRTPSGAAQQLATEHEQNPLKIISPKTTEEG